jgi:hypothetical protein
MPFKLRFLLAIGVSLMSSELEDFLKRAAQRRAEHAAVRGETQERQQRQAQQRKPEYTDRNRERTPMLLEDDEEIIVAEVVASGLDNALSKDSVFQHTSVGSGELSSLRTADAPTHQSSLAPVPPPREYQSPSNWAAKAPVAATVQQGKAGTDQKAASGEATTLVRMLKSPAGIRQAFLMREIFDRPMDRW